MRAHGHTHVGVSVKSSVRMKIPRSGEGDFWGQRDMGPPLPPENKLRQMQQRASSDITDLFGDFYVIFSVYNIDIYDNITF